MNNPIYVSLKKIFFPEVYHEKKFLIPISITLIIGLLIRFIFMPIAFHADIFSAYHRAYLILSDAQYQYIDPNHFIHYLLLLILNGFIPFDTFLSWSGSVTATIDQWIGFASNPYVFRTVVCMKIPYLIFDVFTGILFLHIFKKEPEKGERAFIFWFLNPIIIFTFYIFGRYDVICLFLLVFAFYWYKNNNIFFTGICLGLAIWARIFPIFLVPFFLISIQKEKKDLFLGMIGVIAPLGIFIGINKLFLSQIFNIYSIPSIRLISGTSNTNFIEYILGFNISVNLIGHLLYVFLFGYFIILLYAYFYHDSFHISKEIFFISFSLIVLLFFYSTCTFHPQHFSWLIPILTLAVAFFNDDNLIYLHSLQVLFFGLFVMGFGYGLTVWLFGSLDPTLIFNTSGVLEAILGLFHNLPIVNIGSTLFTAVSIFMAMYIGNNLKKVG